jgi:hypothetical protein
MNHPFITVFKGIRGYFAVLMAYDTELKYHTPLNSSDFSYSTIEEATSDALQWACIEEIEFKRRGA